MFQVYFEYIKNLVMKYIYFEPAFENFCDDSEVYLS